MRNWLFWMGFWNWILRRLRGLWHLCGLVFFFFHLLLLLGIEHWFWLNSILGCCGFECGWYPWWNCCRCHVSILYFITISNLEFLNCLLYSLQSGYSRFPVHEPGKPTSFIGLLLIKKVIYFFIYLLSFRISISNLWTLFFLTAIFSAFNIRSK